MNNNLFNIVLPSVSYLSGSGIPINLTLNAYQIGSYLSIFSGSYISDTSGSVLLDVSIASESINTDQNIFNIYLNNNTYFGSGTDISYQVIVYNYYASVILNTYSASTIGEMSINTLNELSIKYFG